MSGLSEDVRQRLMDMFKQFINASALRPSKACVVKSVSAAPTDGLMTCDCAPIDGTHMLEDVKLCADYPEDSPTNKAGFILVPKAGSIVIVSFKSESEAFVSMVSEVDFIYLNGNGYGGLVKVNDLVARLNILESKMNAFIAWGLTVTPPFPVSTPLIPTVTTDIENPKVTHGDGNLI